ncbi:winged helix-turn-helix transcriptional regulator [Methanoculleus sp. FWC-SCC1]|uniref:Winged helix-turn-helix transcriptional regulator n=1 Tax=Methanoculleus frigidifontis TaxID=2584085 RepID=A0ABT8M738_9EURY|nr:winged helix-turn-helix transcriptional regulator [Methanoculleus sp. FWC-SCC1]MDN7023748.1 winged helix-turn-helix transcriptional regulator [Methanoculleus sp. FWC-SCC1]
MRNRAAALILITLLSLLPAGAAAESSYTVTSAGGFVPDGPPGDAVPIEWWQVPVSILLSGFLSIHAPELVVVVNILVLLNIWLFFGYRRIAKRAALEHDTRTAIYDRIVACPGIHAGALVRDLGVNRGTLQYHLERLQEFGMVTAASVEGHTGYFENRQKYSALEEKMLIHLRNRNAREILSILHASRAASRRELAARLGIAGPSVSWHMHRLAADGIVEVEKDGREKRYLLADATAAALKRHLPASGNRGEGRG